MSGQYPDESDRSNYEDEGPVCPHCGGLATVICRCGGDQCYCDNYGEKECPVCWGEGRVSDERHEAYCVAERANAGAWAAAYQKSQESPHD